MWISSTNPEERLYFNIAWRETFGKLPVGTQEWQSKIEATDLEIARKHWDQAAQDKQGFIVQYAFRDYMGNLTRVCENGTPIFNDDGALRGYLGYGDVCGQHNSDLIQLKASAIDSTTDMVVIAGRDGTIQYVNPAFTKNTGFSSEEAIGNSSRILYSGKQTQSFYDELWRTITAGKPWRGEMINRRKDGSLYYEEQTITPIFGTNGEITHFVAIKNDISVRKNQESHLSYLAQHDPLTGLFNRGAMLQHIKRAIATAGRNHHSVLMFLDLDRFKIVNDTLGHSSGDRLLMALSDLMHHNIRQEDLLGRVGGDEFVIVLPDVDLDQALPIAEKTRQLIANFRYTEAGQTFSLGASIGLAEVDPQSTEDEMLARADTACYRAKDHGRNRVEVYHADEASYLTEGQSWASRLKKAFTDSLFILHYQPVIELSSGKTIRHEALLRIFEHEHGLLPPGAFLPAAERLGMMVDIDCWVIHEAMNALRECTIKDFSDAHLAINVSSRLFRDIGVVDRIRNEALNLGIEPERLTFEVAESIAILNLKDVSLGMQQMHDTGFQLALDDFGGGFSSFSYMRYLPVNELKIDSSFIQGMSHSPLNEAIVQSIINVAHVIGMKVVAKSVEDENTLSRLKDMGCDYAQGFAISKPLATLAQFNAQPIR